MTLGGASCASVACPRCGGCAQWVELITKEDTIEAQRCLNCGEIFGEPVLDHHHALDCPPEPRPDVNAPIYDPELQRLRMVQRLQARKQG